jgi:hypothetical protein
MRCRLCSRTFTQPSKVTRDTQTCSVCRGIKTCLKSRDLCERSPSFIINQIPSQISRMKNNPAFGNNDQGYQKVYSRSI